MVGHRTRTGVLCVLPETMAASVRRGAAALRLRELSHFRIDPTRFRVRPRNLVDAELKVIHDSPGTDTRDVLQNTLK